MNRETSTNLYRKKFAQSFFGTGMFTRLSSYFDTSNLKGDIFGGITAGVVALPLALAFGEASGLGPIAGLWGAIFVGFFAALFGGTPSQVSGPTGPMVVIFAGVLANVREPSMVFMTVVLAGVLLILMGVCRVGHYIRLVPYSVTSGFMSGIGCIIISLQLTRVFGHGPGGNGVMSALKAIPNAVQNPNMHAVVLTVLSLLIVFLWPKVLRKYMPSPLAALIICTIISILMPGAPIIGDIPTGLPSFVIPTMSQGSMRIIIEGAIVLALLCAVDSLLTSLVADNITRTRHDSNRELIGQGIGNTISSLFGSIPGAGATMRTVINVRAGGLTRLSGMIHAMLLVAIVLALGPLASMIPHAVLAGILIKVGYDTIDWNYLRHAHRGPRWDLLLMAIVLTLTVLVDLITGVAVGVVLASLAFVKQVAYLQLQTLGDTEEQISNDQEKALLKETNGSILLFDFDGPLCFGAAADLSHHVRLKSKVDTKFVILNFSNMPMLDLSAAKAVETVAESCRHTGKELYLSGMNAKVRKVLEGLHVLDLVQPDHWFNTRLEALQSAHRIYTAG
jgi:sulfate permease, SulP family